MVSFTHTMTTCKKCGIHYCLGCYGAACPQCGIDEFIEGNVNAMDKLESIKNHIIKYVKHCRSEDPYGYMDLDIFFELLDIDESSYLEVKDDE